MAFPGATEDTGLLARLNIDRRVLPYSQVAQVGPRPARLRMKICRLVDAPDLDEFVVQTQMVSRWLDSLVKLTDGFDLDFGAFTDVQSVATVEAVLRRELPTTCLPSSASFGDHCIG